MQTHLERRGLSGRSYAALRPIWSRGYTTYQQGIHMHLDNRLVDIKDISPLVNTLSQPSERIWLLYPREIQSWLKALWERYSTPTDRSLPTA
ncbi:MAG TPA: hypothetical protein IGR64_08680 [Leptolyngbyaceae cyanobacterium M65_K2018_010]|nr:hypothetical protein [Leptolyngbyaceae cyanobacterium M65_K2018_010]